MTTSFSHLILYFSIYSFLGWFCETLYCSLASGKFEKRGFLKGPLCPIYGIGAFIALIICTPLSYSPLFVFFLSSAAATLLEYFSSWLLEEIFQIRWWDYSDKKLNINGRVCLKNSVIFGVLGLLLTYGIHPLISSALSHLSYNTLRIAANGLLALILLDIITTLSRLLGFSQKLQQLQLDFHELKTHHEKHNWFDSRDLEGSLNRLKALDLSDIESNTLIEKLESAIEKNKLRISQLDTYRNARTQKFTEALESVRKEEIPKTSKDFSATLRKTKTLGSHAAKAGHKTAENIKDTLSYYEMFWIFLFAGVAGYIVETLYCLLKNGFIESRQGLLYGPFSQVYGLGAILMVLFLKPLAKKNDRWIFMGSAFIGGLFEIVCSFFQETVFGSVSWAYSKEAVSLAGGRTSLLYMFFWGILGLLFIKELYPRLLNFIKRIPPKSGKVLTVILSLFLAWDIAISSAAVIRWSERIYGNTSNNTIGIYLDSRYPNEFMETIYPNMSWPNK